ncbi:MAG: hypothetical protein IPM92_01800 [Saprospiraceae bacterium]|nr:hypothetical protein [Saprospiraceae bacterium]
MWSEIRNAFSSYLDALAGSIPALVNALIILLAGWLLARVTKWLVFKACHLAGIDKISEQTAVHRFLERRGFKNGFSGLTSSLFFWLIILIVLVRFFNLLGLDVVSDLLNQVVAFIPSLLVACIILIVGFYLADFVSGLALGSLEESGYEHPELLGKIVFYSIAFFTLAIALTQIGIGEALITNVVSIFFGAIGLAFAIAFGLGGKEWASAMIARYFGKGSNNRER